MEPLKNFILARYIPSEFAVDDNFNPLTFEVEPNMIPDYDFVDSNEEIPHKISTAIIDEKNKEFKEPTNSISRIFDEFNNTVRRINSKKRFDGNKVYKTPIKGSDEFEKAYDEYEKINPDSRKYRKFLTRVAYHESRFNRSAKNKNAPAYGYFQFMQDGKKYNNISAYTGKTINEFINNPIVQIAGAVNMIKDIDKNLTKDDRKKMKKLGISNEGAYGMAWLGGVGGLRKFIHKGINVSDSSWYKGGKGGVDMKEQIKRYNY